MTGLNLDYYCFLKHFSYAYIFKHNQLRKTMFISLVKLLDRIYLFMLCIHHFSLAYIFKDNIEMFLWHFKTQNEARKVFLTKMSQNVMKSEPKVCDCCLLSIQTLYQWLAFWPRVIGKSREITATTFFFSINKLIFMQNVKFTRLACRVKKKGVN